jgi:hypothetical protein
VKGHIAQWKRHKYRDKLKSSRQLLATRVNPIHYISDEPGSNETDDDHSLNLNLESIDVPDTDEDHKVFHVYCAFVYPINPQPDTARDTTCIVCGQSHWFDKCNVLANTDFLRGHYIQYCQQQFRRDATARKKEFPGKGDIPNTAATAPVRSMDATHSSDSDSDQDSIAQDFHAETKPKNHFFKLTNLAHYVYHTSTLATIVLYWY